MPKDHQAGQQSRRTESRAGIVTMSTVEGTLRILWENHIRPEVSPRYRLLFDRYKDFNSGAQQSKRLLGKDGLESYLLRIKVTAQDAKHWIKRVHEKLYISIPHDASETNGSV